jgi:aromatic-L-amino-acid decarboxylase
MTGLVMYCSEHAHSSIEKAAIAAGIGLNNVRKIEVDECFRMSTGALAASIDEDLRAGKRPFCVVATIGTTPTAAVDPVPEIASLCRQHGLWLHVDAAYGGAAAVLPEMRHVLEGCHDADSFVVNPHKWLLTPIDLSAFYTSRPELLRGALSLVPEYLRTGESPRAVNLMDYGVPLGRRFRALKLWFVMRSLGRSGIQKLIRTHIALAREFAEWVRADDRFEVCAPVNFSLVCFRLRAPDESNRALLEAINSSGLAFPVRSGCAGPAVRARAPGSVSVPVWR